MILIMVEIIKSMNNKMNQKGAGKIKTENNSRRKRRPKKSLNRKITSIMKSFMIKKIKN
jgi:hypothetical protein